MCYKNKPPHTANNKGYSGENNQLLQYFHDLLLINLICLATGIRQDKLSYKLTVKTIDFRYSLRSLLQSGSTHIFRVIFGYFTGWRNAKATAII